MQIGSETDYTFCLKNLLGLPKENRNVTKPYQSVVFSDEVVN